MSIPEAPTRRVLRRPKRSTVQKDSGVEKTLISVKMREIRNVLLIAPVDCRNGVE
jgi:hypothetical protein